MLRKIRIVLAAVFFIMITLLLFLPIETLQTCFGWMAGLQLPQSALAQNFIAVIAVVVLTILLGRVYCSVICPLGVFQDIVSWIGGKRKKADINYHYKKENYWLRYGMLVVFAVVMALGFYEIACLIAPYSIFSNVMGNLFAPIQNWINPILIASAVILVAIIVLAWRGGRTWCNNICPIGTALSLFSRFSLFCPVINKDKCANCGLCEKQCKAFCIDSANHKIDHSRCVDCMNCINSCNKGAISYKWHYAKQSTKDK
ncbi:MAG: 4Fe-4S binding protein [Paludibacteraceae bacterium]|nr:4Fe-4S binding protein [Paludibacteraceae bacterium]MCQ2369972.1 4Fe-4S binding protein [Paludibacteraceae bacterium]